MHPLEKEIRNLVLQENLLVSGETVVVGVSAGPDSVALLHVLSSLSRELSLRLVAVYVDHGLRPLETEEEKKLVKKEARALGSLFEIAEVAVEKEAAKRKISIEHAARDLRYQVFNEVGRKYKATKIGVAHTADDQAEEVLLRLLRGTGRSGLSGMDMMRDGKIIRPFLGTEKGKLLSYLEDKKIGFLVDSSNLERKYLRNRVRLDLLPFLADFNPNISETLRQTAAVLADEEKLLGSMTEESWKKLGHLSRDESGEMPVAEISLAGFLSSEPAIQRRLAEKAFIIMGAVPQFKKIEQILFLARNGESGAMLHFNKGLRLKKTRDCLNFSYPQGRVAKRGNLD